MANYDPNMSGTQTYGGSSGAGSSGSGNDVKDRASDVANTVKERASDAANTVKDRASEWGRSAVNAIDRGMDTAADKLHNTASSLRNAGSGDSRVGTMANRAADGIEGAANYFRDHDVSDIVGDIEGAVRRNPGPSLLIAAAFGFLLGSAVRGNNRSRY